MKITEDSIEKKKEQNRIRVQNFRQKKKLEKQSENNQSTENEKQKYVVSSHSFFIVDSRTTLEFEAAKHKISSFFKDNIKFGLIAEEQHGDMSKHFQMSILLHEPIELDCDWFNTYYGKEVHIRPIESEVDNFIYNLKEGKIAFLTEDTKTVLIPFLLGRAKKFQPLLEAARVLIKKFGFKGSEIYTIVKDNFISTYKKELKRELLILDEERLKIDFNLTEILHKLIAFFKDRMLKKYSYWMNDPFIFHENLMKIFEQNQWLAKIDVDTDLTAKQKTIIKEYNENCDSFVTCSLVRNFEDFIVRKRSLSNYAIYVWSDGVDKFKSSFFELFKFFCFFVEKDETNNSISFTSEEYEDYKFPFTCFDDIDISYYGITYIKRLVSGSNTHIRILGNAYKRNDRTLVIFTSNFTCDETYAALRRIDPRAKMPDKGFYKRIKEINANTQFLRDLFFDTRDFMKTNNIPYPQDSDEIQRNNLKSRYMDYLWNYYANNRKRFIANKNKKHEN